MTLAFETPKTTHQTLTDLIDSLDNQTPIQRLITARNEASNAAWLAEAMRPLLDSQAATVAEIEAQLEAVRAEYDKAQRQADEAAKAVEEATPDDQEARTVRREATKAAYKKRQIVTTIFNSLGEEQRRHQAMTTFVEGLQRITPPGAEDLRRLLTTEFC